MFFKRLFGSDRGAADAPAKAAGIALATPVTQRADALLRRLDPRMADAQMATEGSA